LAVADITSFEFSKIADIVYGLTGIHLKDTKKTLVVSRLSRRLKALHLSSFQEYIQYLTKGNTREREIPELINSITTNTTEFFREPAHFEYLKNLLPKIWEEGERKGRRTLRVWCSASSTGEEPYSIAMVLHSFFETKRGWKVKVLASDIDTNVLAVASRGIYRNDKTTGIPIMLRTKYLTQVPGEVPPGHVKISSDIRSMLVFRKINLIVDPFRFSESVDIIFCRNVVIYFDEVGKQKLVDKFSAVLRSGGYIFVGHSESLLIQRNTFEFMGNTIYRRI